MEIVSKPDLRSSEQAKAYLTKLRTIMRYLGTCDGNMEQGSLRADINVSVRKPGDQLGTRCEIKNVNSIRFIGQAIEHEARRQIEILEEGGAIVPGDAAVRCEDRGDAVDALQGRGARLPLFPRPGPPAARADAGLCGLRSARDLPELPDQKRARFISDYGLTPTTRTCWSPRQRGADYFEAVATGGASQSRRRTGS